MTRTGNATLPTAAFEVLESIYQHWLLTTPQIHAIHTPHATRRWTQRLLAALARKGLIDGTNGWHGVGIWFATPAGAAAVDRQPTRAELRRKLITPEQAGGQLQAHTLAVNDVGIAYLRAARARRDEFGPLSWRHEIAHALGPEGRRRPGDLLIADALLTYLTADAEAVSHHQRLLELDRGTMPVEALVGKLRAYQRLRDDDAWRRWYPAGLPPVQLVLAGKPRPRLERRVRVLLALRDADPRLRGGKPPHLQLALLDDLRRHGPFAPIWLRADDPSRRVDWLDLPGRSPR